ncbi:hypothetical protein Cni_G24321 [Canna indica]|uniref:Maternal effect embryo arrest 59 n=1 Tax=Canna indica TaxID=4628 RepID=A0AAQ3QPG4_9LILI|nr:hypothetical protein Cni_G24321 [Canna indica]
MSRPDRSDAHLPPEEEARIEAETREYFQGIAPKRHTKPSRSDYSAVYSDALRSDSDSIPELENFQHLQAHPQEKLVCDGSQSVEEYVETEYYTDLNCIDKQHHTTGTGFIKIDKAKGGNDFALTQACLCDASGCQPHLKGNPATNEWIPSADIVIPDSHKPKRSDI